MPWHAVRPADRVALIGSCLVGRHARIGHPAMVRVLAIRELVRRDDVREVIPVGSGGVHGELTQLAARGILVGTAGRPDPAEWSGSGGPATAALVIASPDSDLPASATRLQPEVPFQWIGQVYEISERTAR